MRNRLPMFISSVAVGIVFAGAALFLLGSEAKAKPMAVREDAQMTGASAIPQLVAMWDEMHGTGEMVNFDEKAHQDRIDKVRKLASEGKLQCGADYLYAAMIVNEGKSADDALLAHDFGIVALTMGEQRARRVVATSEDRFLTMMGRSQRFGTQTKSKDGKSVLLEVDPAVSDGMRRAIGVPSVGATKQMLSEGKTAVEIFGPNMIAPEPTIKSISIAAG